MIKKVYEVYEFKFKDKKKKGLFKNARVVVSCPSDLSEVNVLAFRLF